MLKRERVGGGEYCVCVHGSLTSTLFICLREYHNPQQVNHLRKRLRFCGVQTFYLSQQPERIYRTQRTNKIHQNYLNKKIQNIWSFSTMDDFCPLDEWSNLNMYLVNNQMIQNSKSRSVFHAIVLQKDVN